MRMPFSPALSGLLAELHDLTEVTNTAIPYQSGKIVDTPWNAQAATDRVAKWASSDGSGNNDKVNWTKYGRAFAAKDGMHTSIFGAYHLPHHDIEGGELVVNKAGVVAAIAAINGGRGGYQGPDSKGAMAHLEKHRKDWEKAAEKEKKAKAEAERGAADDVVDIQGVVAQIEPSSGGKKAKLYCYGAVRPASFWDMGEDTVSAQKIRQVLDENPGLEELELHVYSPGGSLFEGLAIYQTLHQHPANIVGVVDSLAASAAAAFLMACDRIDMPSSSVMMVHGVRNATVGGEREHADGLKMIQVANRSLAEIYMQRTGLSEAAVTDILSHDTWMSAREAVAQGFADNCLPGKAPPMRRGMMQNSVSNFLLISPESDPRRLAAVLDEIPEGLLDELSAGTDVTEPEAAPEPVTPAPEPTPEPSPETPASGTSADPVDPPAPTTPAPEDLPTAPDAAAAATPAADAAPAVTDPADPVEPPPPLVLAEDLITPAPAPAEPPPEADAGAVTDTATADRAAPQPAPSAAMESDMPGTANPTGTTAAPILVLSKLGVQDEHAACAVIDRLASESEFLTKLLNVLGTNKAEAEGKIRGLFQAAARLPDLEAEIQRHVTRERDEEKKRLIAQGRADRKIVTDQQLEWCLAQNVETLRGWLESAPPMVPQSAYKPPTPLGAGTPTWNGKKFSELTPIERHNLKNESPDLYRALRAADSAA